MAIYLKITLQVKCCVVFIALMKLQVRHILVINSK
jgi:hypothetical protein